MREGDALTTNNKISWEHASIWKHVFNVQYLETE